VTTLIIGCGYLGQRLGARLHQQGERVFGIVRSPGRADVIAALGIEAVIADVLVPESLSRLPEADRVFYSVGYDRATGSSMRAVYVDGLQNVLDKLPHSVKRFVYASSTGVYGQTNGEWVEETSPACPQHESGRVCLAAEELVLNWANTNDHSASAIILRFAGLYGPGRIVRRSILERGEPIPGDPQKFLNLIHIDDAAQAASAALATGNAEPIYVVSDDRPVTRQEYYGRMATLLDAPSPRFEPPTPGSPDAARDATNKRIANDRIKSGLGIALIYPDITTGLSSCLSPNHQPGLTNQRHLARPAPPGPQGPGGLE
jgi:nucleoside-diphosphate-sugar epimerase